MGGQILIEGIGLKNLEMKIEKWPRRAKWGQAGPSGANWCQTGPKGIKRGHMGPNAADFLHAG